MQTKSNLHQLYPGLSEMYIPVGPCFLLNRETCYRVCFPVSPLDLAARQRRKKPAFAYMPGILTVSTVMLRLSKTRSNDWKRLLIRCVLKPMNGSFSFLPFSFILLFLSLTPFLALSKFRLLRRTWTADCTRLLERWS